MASAAPQPKRSTTPTPAPAAAPTAAGDPSISKAALREEMAGMNPDQKIALLKKAIVTLTKTKNELEIRVGGLMEELDSSKMKITELTRANQNLRAELDDTKAKLLTATAPSAASTALKGITQIIPGLGFAKKQAAPDAAAAKDSGTLSREDAIQIIQENEKLHIHMYENKAAFEKKLAILQQECESLKSALQTAQEVAAQAAEGSHDSDKKLKSTVAENKQLSSAVELLLESSKEMQRLALTDANWMEELKKKLAPVLKGTSLEEQGQSPSGDDGAVTSSSRQASERVIPAVTVLQYFSELTSAMEGIGFAVLALGPACADAIQNLLRNHRDTAEWKRRLRVFAEAIRNSNQQLRSTLGPCSTVDPSGMIDRHAIVAAWEGLLQWLAPVLNHSPLLIQAVLLSAGTTVEASKSEAQTLFAHFQAFALRLLCWIKEQIAFTSTVAQQEGTSASGKILGSTPIQIVDADEMHGKVIPGFHRVLALLGKEVHNEKVKLPLQHIAVKLKSLAELIQKAKNVSLQQTVERQGSTPEKSKSSPEPTRVPEALSGRPVALGGSGSMSPTSASEKELDQISRQLEDLKVEKQQLREVALLADKRVSRMHGLLTQALMELEAKGAQWEEKDRRIAELQAQIAKGEADRAAMTEAFEEQIRVLSNRLVELSQ